MFEIFFALHVFYYGKSTENLIKLGHVRKTFELIFGINVNFKRMTHC